jgi:SAM-dependent methyltransferase
MNIKNSIYYKPYRQLEAENVSFADYAKRKSIYTQLAPLFDATNIREPETSHEADFLVSLVQQHLEQDKYSFLDIACGTGRHVKELTKRGYQAAGVDASRKLINIARKSTPEAKFILADMRTFQVDTSFDCIYSFWDSYTYLSRAEDMKAFAGQCSAHLKRGGILVLDSKNHYIRPDVTIEHRIVSTGDLQIDMLIRRESHLSDKVYEAIFTNIIQDTKTGEARVVVDQTLARIYNVMDLERSLQGFRLVNSYGNFNGSAFEIKGSERLITVFQKM